MDQFYLVLRHSLLEYYGDYNSASFESNLQLFEHKEDAIKKFQELSWSKEAYKKNNVFLCEIGGEDLALTNQLLSTHIKWNNIKDEQEYANKYVLKLIDSWTEILKKKRK